MLLDKLDIFVETNFHSDREIFVIVDAFPRLLDHLAHERVLVDERGANALLNGPLLRTAAVELDTVAMRMHELGGGGEIVAVVGSELGYERSVGCVRRELDVA